MPPSTKQVGRIVQIIGPVLDVQFEQGHLPSIYTALRITSEGFKLPEPLDVTAEVQQHLGEGRVRVVAMEPTEGMVRGMKAYDTGKPIVVPVGRPTLGRVMNVLGKPVDQLGPITSDKFFPIHREAPSLEDVTDPVGRTFRAFADQTRSDRKALAACLRGSRGLMTRDDAAGISVPVLIAVGTADEVAGSAEALGHIIPRSEVLDIPNRDHMRAVGDKVYKTGVNEFLSRRP